MYDTVIKYVQKILIQYYAKIQMLAETSTTITENWPNSKILTAEAKPNIRPYPSANVRRQLNFGPSLVLNCRHNVAV